MAGIESETNYLGPLAEALLDEYAWEVIDLHSVRVGLALLGLHPDQEQVEQWVENWRLIRDYRDGDPDVPESMAQYRDMDNVDMVRAWIKDRALARESGAA